MIDELFFLCWGLEILPIVTGVGVGLGFTGVLERLSHKTLVVLLHVLGIQTVDSSHDTPLHIRVLCSQSASESLSVVFK